MKEEVIMPVKAQQVTMTKDNSTFCRISEGYGTVDEIEIELASYEEVATLQGDLPDSDEKWPKGAPIKGYVKVGNKILKTKAA